MAERKNAYRRGGRRSFTFAVAAYNLTRLPKLIGVGHLVFATGR
jgi:hypothetical protein